MAIFHPTTCPHDAAEKTLLVEPGRLSLDDLARLLSEENGDEEIIVRDARQRPAAYSRVYWRGKAITPEPYEWSRYVSFVQEHGSPRNSRPASQTTEA